MYSDIYWNILLITSFLKFALTRISVIMDMGEKQNYAESFWWHPMFRNLECNFRVAPIAKQTALIYY